MSNLTLLHLFEDCKSLIKKDHESWKSYFSKWEIFAKYEESIPESELRNAPFDCVKSVKKKKLKQSSSKKKIKRMSSLTVQKNQRYKKKHSSMSKISLKSTSEKKIIKDYINFKSDNIVADLMNDRMETILKSVFTNFLKDNMNNLEAFAVLSQTYSNTERIDSNQLISHQQGISCYKLLSNERSSIMNHHISPSTVSAINICNTPIFPARDIYIQSFRKNFNFFDFYAKQVTDNKLNRTGNLTLNSIPKFEFSCKSDKNQQQFLMPVCNNETPQQAIQTNFDIKACHPILFDGPKHKNAELKPFKLDFNHKSPTSVFRKINKEYSVKKTFPKMNIIQDEKRFKNLCLRKRTNSVSLSMGNSNFITPERKPSEQKCFSENVLQRKRGHPSKLFFDNEEEDSESDDQTQNQAPLIHYQNKIKSQVFQKVMDDDSDSDDCESIFDRIEKS